MEKTFRTHDGVELSIQNDGDRIIWYSTNDGKIAFKEIIDHPDNIKLSTYLQLPSDAGKYVAFSTEQACQEYIDKMNSPVIFTTQDGVDMRIGDEYWCVAIGIIYGPYLCDENSMCYQGGPYYSSEAKAQEYLDSLSTVQEPSKTVDQIGIDHTGKPIFEGYEIYCCWNLNNQLNITSQANAIIATKEAIANTKDYCYFVHQSDADMYIEAAKCLELSRKVQTLQEPIVPIDSEYLKHVNVKIGPAESKSELELAYDKLTALCAKYCQDNTRPQIDTISHYPNGVTKYSIILFSGYGELLLYKTPEMHFLDEAVILTNAWLIQNRHFID